MLTNDFPSDAIGAVDPILQLGFACADASTFKIVLASRNVKIEIYYDAQYSCEVGLEISLMDVDFNHITFNLGEVFREAGVPDADSRSFCQTQHYTRALQFLSEAALVLVEYAKPCLLGDRHFFQRLRQRQSREAAEYTIHANLQAARPRAYQAWKSKNYSEFIRLLAPHEAFLTESERKKLGYASKTLSGGET